MESDPIYVETEVEFWPQRIAAHLQNWDVVGVAGTTRLTTPAVMGSGSEYVHGWMAQPNYERAPIKGAAPTGYMAGLLSATTTPVKAEALDGVFIAARRQVFERVSFDAQTFDRFHGYDIDFTYRCYQAGLNVAVCPDLWLVHFSEGDFGSEWVEYAERLQKKFPTLNSELKSPTYFAHGVRDMVQLQAAYERLWAAANAV
jgi:GT2 family glycosyltransferase